MTQNHPNHINVTVRYPAATKPFVDPHADPHETVEHLKARVLDAFQVQEIRTPDSSTLYFLFHDNQRLDNPSATLLEIADSEHHVKLRLVQQIIQGDGGGDLQEMAFEQDLTELLETEEARQWAIKKCACLTVDVRMAPTSSPKEEFIARLAWDKYGDSPPSLKFVDPTTDGLTNPQAWPICPGFRPSSLDACVSWTKEGHGLHPEWLSAPSTKWDPNGNVLFRILNILQDTLDTGFSGRYQS